MTSQKMNQDIRTEPEKRPTYLFEPMRIRKKKIFLRFGNLRILCINLCMPGHDRSQLCLFRYDCSEPGLLVSTDR